MNKMTLLLVRLIAGWLAEQIMGRSQTLIMNLVLSIAGAFLRSFLATRVFNVRNDEGLNPATIAITTAARCCCLSQPKPSPRPRVHSSLVRREAVVTAKRSPTKPERCTKSCIAAE
jgi:uncharacterized membrane protein YeaQ/YmgE (transglycosylase-associated protein family)